MEGRDARAILANEVYSRVDVFRDAVSSRAVEIADKIADGTMLQ